MTAPTINGRYPQTVEELLPVARKLVDELGEVPSRNRLMRDFRIGAPKAGELLALLRDGAEREAAVLLSAMADTDVPAPGVGIGRSVSPIGDTTSAPSGPDLRPVFLAPDPGPGPVVPGSAGATDAGASVGDVVPSGQVTAPGHPGTPTRRRAVAWPVVLLALPAFVAIWSGWVGLGGLTGFGVVHPLPGIADGVSLNTAITLPVGVETYGAYALYVWLSGRVPDRARRFARWSAIASLLVGALGQVAYHLLAAAGVTAAPWQITTAVACLPVAVLGMGAALAHLVRD